MKAPIPHPTRAMLARAQADASHHVERDWLTRLGGVVSSGPDNQRERFSGQCILAPPGEPKPRRGRNLPLLPPALPLWPLP